MCVKGSTHKAQRGTATGALERAASVRVHSLDTQQRLLDVVDAEVLLEQPPHLVLRSRVQIA